MHRLYTFPLERQYEIIRELEERRQQEQHQNTLKNLRNLASEYNNRL